MIPAGSVCARLLAKRVCGIPAFHNGKGPGLPRLWASGLLGPELIRVQSLMDQLPLLDEVRRAKSSSMCS